MIFGDQSIMTLFGNLPKYNFLNFNLKFLFKKKKAVK